MTDMAKTYLSARRPALEGLDQLILSREACESLCMIAKTFPAIGSYESADINDISYSGGVRGFKAHVHADGNLLPAREKCAADWRGSAHFMHAKEGTAASMPTRTQDYR